MEILAAMVMSAVPSRSAARLVGLPGAPLNSSVSKHGGMDSVRVWCADENSETCAAGTIASELMNATPVVAKTVVIATAIWRLGVLRTPNPPR